MTSIRKRSEEILIHDIKDGIPLLEKVTGETPKRQRRKAELSRAGEEGFSIPEPPHCDRLADVRHFVPCRNPCFYQNPGSVGAHEARRKRSAKR